MSTRVLLLLGTKKGAFILESDSARREWCLRGPFCEAWPIFHLVYDPAGRAIYGGAGNEWYGAAVWRSGDLGSTWTHSSEGLSYGDDGPSMRGVWNVTPGLDAVYAGVEPAGLFRSDDNGATWTHVQGLREHPSTPDWQPGGGGLCLHSIVLHPTDAQQMWVAISAVGTFYTQDGGRSWVPRNKGVRADFMPEKYPELGQCVHSLRMARQRPNLLFQENHCGVYRSENGGESWEEITAGLPSDFGFPLAVHPRDPRTIYVVQLDAEAGRFMPGGQAAVWRSRSAGDRWEKLTNGLPQRDAYLGVLRRGMDMDELEPAGIYFGTGTGQLFASADEGDSWREIASYLPPISSVQAAVVTD